MRLTEKGKVICLVLVVVIGVWLANLLPEVPPCTDSQLNWKQYGTAENYLAHIRAEAEKREQAAVVAAANN